MKQMMIGHLAKLRGLAEKMHGALVLPQSRQASIGGPQVEPWIRLGGFVLFVLFGGFLLWATLAPISSAALGNGSIKVETNRKTVQNLEGGILRDIVIREGQSVVRGQVLFRLDSVDTDADRDSLQGQYDLLLAREWRLNALRASNDKAETIPFPDLPERARLKSALSAQKQILDEQRDSLEKQIDIWKRRKDQFVAQLDATRVQLSALEAQRPLLEEELSDARSLLAKGYGLKPRVLGLERQIEAMRGEIGNTAGRLASLQEQVAETDVQIMSILSAHGKQIAEDMQEVQAKKAEAEDGLKKISARHERREITAPVDGVAMNIRLFTPGAIVAPGGALIDIVPVGEKLLIEARLKPTDIDVIRPDLQASVRFIAYKQRNTPSVQGTVVRVSADIMQDERTRESFYAATIEVASEELARVPQVRLYPGMPVEVAIVTGERSMLGYLMQPLLDSMSHSFREE